MTGAVLAGGKSRRMGFNKAFIKIEGEAIIRRVISALDNVTNDVTIVTNTDDVVNYDIFDIRVVADIYAAGGSLGGIYTALFHTASQFCFVAACDMPYLNAAVIKEMESTGQGYDIVIPEIRGRMHPLHAIYSRDILGIMETMLTEGNLRISNLLDSVRLKILKEDFFTGKEIIRSVMNINTPVELSDAVL